MHTHRSLEQILSTNLLTVLTTGRQMKQTEFLAEEMSRSKLQYHYCHHPPPTAWSIYFRHLYIRHCVYFGRNLHVMANKVKTDIHIVSDSGSVNRTNDEMPSRKKSREGERGRNKRQTTPNPNKPSTVKYTATAYI